MITFNITSDSYGNGYDHLSASAFPGDNYTINKLSSGMYTISVWQYNHEDKKHHSMTFFIDDIDAFLEKVQKAKEQYDNR